MVTVSPCPARCLRLRLLSPAPPPALHSLRLWSFLNNSILRSGFCARKGIRAKEVILNSLDVANALVQYISNNFITDIVLGAFSRSAIARAFKNIDIACYLGKSTPDTCSVYAIWTLPSIGPLIERKTPELFLLEGLEAETEEDIFEDVSKEPVIREEQNTD
ncbi:unnamed protein product [Fraxinus pennsylvanica]|uniref:RING-type E3 ubiquitin transferase n=1 Tax=Fraxinus pennsylvanica TaxID=56036 RepID=A0AAD1YVQ5_9LAMI|nr:unnamed protein product [Fraxinus pennsylvanica]